MGTLFSLFVALFLVTSPDLVQDSSLFVGVGIGMIVVGVFFLLFLSVVFMASWSPLQRAENSVTPRLLEMFRKDRQIRMIDFWFILFFLFSLVAGFDMLAIHRINPFPLLAAWTVGLGISIDFLHHLLKRILNYLNPFSVVKFFTESARKSIQNDDEESLCNSIDALAEIAVQAITTNGISLCNQAVNELELIEKHFLESTKTVGHDNANQINYTLYYILQRIEMIFDKGLMEQIEPTCSRILTVVGKMSIHAAKCDLSLTPIPIRTLGNMAFVAEATDFHEIGDKGLCTLMEVANILVEDVDLSYGDIKEPFLTLVAQMEMITKEMFSNDKMINFELLIDPFRTLKELLTGNEKLLSNGDLPIIIHDIDRVLADFTSLEAILKTLPPIPEEALTSS